MTSPLDPATPRDPDGQDADYREIFERSADAILIIDGDTFIDCNEATVRMLRYPNREALLQTHPSELSPEFQPDGRASFEKANEMMGLAFAGGSHRFEWDHKRADGEVFPVEVLLTAVPRGDSLILHTVWRDITDRKRLEGELRQAQKMEAVGKLAGGIAHDFNNLLVAIVGHTQLLELDLANQPGMLTHLAEIERAADRATALVSQLLAFSRNQVVQPRVIDLNRVLGDLEGMLEGLLGEDIDIVRIHATGILPVLMDPGQFEQVALNLATNARDAMTEGGRLTLETSTTVIAPESDHVPGCLPPGSYATLTVTDTGEGINPAVLSRIFDPFFTTKDPGKGTGLGLATVYGIVKQCGGETTVASEPGRGTVFQVFLPLDPGEPVATAPVPDITSTPNGSETVLVVEDEPSVLKLVEQVLRSHGYTVHTAVDGIEALAVIDALDQKIDLLLTDVVMPRMGGPELARRLQAAHPRLKVVFTSGYTDDTLVHRGVLNGDVNLLQKPYAPNELLRKIQDVFAPAARDDD